MKIKHFFNEIYLYAICLIIIFQSYTVLQFEFPRLSSGLYYILIILILLSISVLLKEKSTSIDYKKVLLFIILYVMYLLLYVLFQNQGKGYLVNFYVTNFFLMFILVLYCTIKKVSIFKYISKIIVCYSYLNLVLFILISVFKLVNPTSIVDLYSINHLTYESFNYIFFQSHYVNFLGFNLARNCGIFLEPAVYSIFIGISLINELYLENKVKRLNIFILLISSITIMSTTGYIIIISIICVKIMFSDTKNKSIKFIKVYLIPLIVIVSLYGIYYFLNLKNATDETDIVVRNQDFLYSIILFKQKPILGWGLGNIDLLLNMHSIERGYDYGLYSNGLAVLLYQGGMYIISLYLASAFSVLKSFESKKDAIVKLLFLITFIVELSTFPFQKSILGMLILAYGFIFIVKKKRNLFLQNEDK